MSADIQISKDLTLPEMTLENLRLLTGHQHGITAWAQVMSGELPRVPQSGMWNQRSGKARARGVYLGFRSAKGMSQLKERCASRSILQNSVQQWRPRESQKVGLQLPRMSRVPRQDIPSKGRSVDNFLFNVDSCPVTNHAAGI
jgi:hypothetical protein